MSAQSPKLRAFLSGVPCGTITENAHGALSFSYDESYHGVPLSLSMPVGLAPFDDHTVRPYLMGAAKQNSPCETYRELGSNAPEKQRPPIFSSLGSTVLITKRLASCPR